MTIDWGSLETRLSDAAKLRQILEDTDAEYLIHLQVSETRSGTLILTYNTPAPIAATAIASYCRYQDEAAAAR